MRVLKGGLRAVLLDSGICTVYRKRNTAQPGGKPTFENVQIHRGWYGELSFETTPMRPTEKREEVRTDARVRILQNRNIANHDRVELLSNLNAETVYEVTRAYHGRDDESGELITDLSLEVVTP